MSEGRFQVAVGGIIERSDGKLLLIQRAEHIPAGGIWEFPIGRLKQFETIEDGLRREITEETGITDIQVLMPLSAFTFMRGGETADHEVKGITFWCKTNEKEAVLSDEHQAQQWVTVDQAIAMTVKGVQQDFHTFRLRRVQMGD